MAIGETSTWSVLVEYKNDSTKGVTIDELAEAFDGPDGPKGDSVISAPEMLEPGDRWSVRLLSDGHRLEKILAQAVAEAGKAIRCADLPSTFGTVLACEVISLEELARRLDEEQLPELVGVSELARMLDVSRQRASELARTDRFPDPIAELDAGPVWIRLAVEAFVENWDRRPGRPTAVGLVPTESQKREVTGTSAGLRVAANRVQNNLKRVTSTKAKSVAARKKATAKAARKRISR